MRNALYQIFVLTGKDLRIEARSRQTLGLVIVLGLLIVVVLGLGLEGQRMANPGVPAASSTNDLSSTGAPATPTPANLSAFGATAVLWVAYLFAGVLCFEKTMAMERTDGALAGLLLAPLDRGLIYISKLISNLALILSVALVVTPAGVLFFNFDLSVAPGSFVLIVGTAIIGFAAVGTLFAAIVSSSRLQGGLLALMIFPVSLPLVIASSRMMTGIFLEKRPLEASSLGILAAFDVIFLAAGWLMFDFALEA
jgi:heme exporter protein B